VARYERDEWIEGALADSRRGQGGFGSSEESGMRFAASRPEWWMVV